MLTADEYVKAESYKDEDTKNRPNAIVIHHTAAEYEWKSKIWIVAAINTAHHNRTRELQPTTPAKGCTKNQTWCEYGYVSYHFLIFADGTYYETRPLDVIWWHTKQTNKDSVWITLVWNFQNHKPSAAQYKTLNELIARVESMNEIKEVKWHWQYQWEKTACPGKMFDYSQVKKPTKQAAFSVEWQYASSEFTAKLFGVEKIKTDPNYLWTFNVTKYYSCRPDQDKWLDWEYNTLKKRLWREPSNDELYKECNRRQFNGDPDNLQPKHWAAYTNEDAWVAVACPPWIPWWSILRIDWYWEVVCRDVWSAIQNKRLDLYAWIWNRAIENRWRFPSWNHKIYLVKKFK